MRLSRCLLASLVIAGAAAAALPTRAQDATGGVLVPAAPETGSPATARDFVPGPDTLDDTIYVTVRGHAEVIASSVVLEYIIRGPAESAAEAEKNYTKKIRAAIKGMADTDPVTSLIHVDVVGHKKQQVGGFIFKLNSSGRPPFTGEAGATFACRFYVGIHDLDAVPPRVATQRLAEILQKLNESELTGAEDDVDIMAAHMEVDLDRLRVAAYADALGAARSRASALAALTRRKLGKVTLIRENGWTCNNEQTLFSQNYFNFVYPGNLQGWRAQLRVHADVDLAIAFQLD